LVLFFFFLFLLTSGYLRHFEDKFFFGKIIRF
jgi:hypothetical protein